MMMTMTRPQRYFTKALDVDLKGDHIMLHINIKREVMGRSNGLFSFDTTRTAEKATRPTTITLLSTFSSVFSKSPLLQIRQLLGPKPIFPFLLLLVLCGF
jgi:hypothetical protein